MARLQFDIVENDAVNWAIVRLHPEPHSGAATTPGRVIDGSTGTVIDWPSSGGATPGQTVIVLEGSWELIGSVTGEAPAATRGSYSWVEPPKDHVHEMTASDLYSPFEKGGVVLCRYNAGAEPDKQFDPVFLLPPNWERAVRPGYEWFKSHRTLFSDGAATASAEAKGPVVLGGNPILSVMIFRLLAEAGSLTPELFGAASGHGDLYLQADLIYILLLNAPALQNERLAAGLEHRFESATTIEDQRAAGLAIFTRMMLNQAVAPAGGREARLLQVLRRRGAVSDPYLREIFHTLGG